MCSVRLPERPEMSGNIGDATSALRLEHHGIPTKAADGQLEQPPVLRYHSHKYDAQYVEQEKLSINH